MKYNIWLMPYGNFGGENHNATWGICTKIKEELNKLESSEKNYNCRIRRVGVNIYDADNAVNEVEFIDESGELPIHIIIAFGTGGPDGLFNFEHTGDATHNGIGYNQYDLYGREIPNTLKEYGTDINGATAGWYYSEKTKDLVRKTEYEAGQYNESSGAGDYLCGYMTEKLASSSALSGKSFFIHVQDIDPEKESETRNRSAILIANFIDQFLKI